MTDWKKIAERAVVVARGVLQRRHYSEEHPIVTQLEEEVATLERVCGLRPMEGSNQWNSVVAPVRADDELTSLEGKYDALVKEIDHALGMRGTMRDVEGGLQRLIGQAIAARALMSAAEAMENYCEIGQDDDRVDDDEEVARIANENRLTILAARAAGVRP